MYRILRNCGVAVAAVAALDPATVVFKAVYLRKLRANHPELFEPRLAAESVEGAIADALSHIDV